MTTQDERTVEELQAQERADAFANDLRKLADICADAPWFAEHIRWQFTRFNAPCSSGDDDPALHVMRRAARLGMDAGLKVAKGYDDTWGSVTLRMPNGLVNIWVYAARSEVCERVVKGTREVTKEVCVFCGGTVILDTAGGRHYVIDNGEPVCCREPMVHNTGGWYECADAYFYLSSDDEEHPEDRVLGDIDLIVEREALTDYQRDRYDHWRAVRVMDEAVFPDGT